MITLFAITIASGVITVAIGYLLGTSATCHRVAREILAWHRQLVPHATTPALYDILSAMLRRVEHLTTTRRGGHHEPDPDLAVDRDGPVRGSGR